MRRWPRERQQSREARVWDLRLRGYTQMRIAAEVGLHQGTVSRILARVSLRVARQMHRQIAQRKMEQVAQLEHIAQEAMEAWERSKEATKSIQQRKELPRQTGDDVVGRGQGRETVTSKVEDEDGDTRYLDTAMKALAEIRKVLDMEKVPLVGDGGTLIMRQEVTNQNHVLVIGGPKDKYIERLRRLRGAG